MPNWAPDARAYFLRLSRRMETIDGVPTAQFQNEIVLMEKAAEIAGEGRMVQLEHVQEAARELGLVE